MIIELENDTCTKKTNIDRITFTFADEQSAEICYKNLCIFFIAIKF